jgi:group I intron endonuclease
MSQVAIYSITNAASGKKYIGQSANPNHRFAVHKSPSSRSIAIQNAINKHGKEAFEFKVLAVNLSREEANEAERYLIGALGTMAPVGYNIAPGGDAHIAGWKWSSETREKRRAAQAERKSRETPPLSCELKKRFSSISRRCSAHLYWSDENARKKQKDVLSSPETRRRMRASASAKFADSEMRAGYAERMRALSRDPVIRKRMDASRRLFWKNNPAAREKQAAKASAVAARPGVKLRMSLARRGKKASHETRARQSAAIRLAYNAPGARERRSEMLRRLWADPSYRKMILAARKARLAAGNTDAILSL